MASDNKNVFDFDDLIGRTDVFEVLFKNFDLLEKRINKLAKLLSKEVSITNPNDTKALDRQAKEVAKLEAALMKLRAEKAAATKARKKTIDLTNEELIAIQKEKDAQRDRIAIAKQTAIIQKRGAESIAGLRAQLSLTTLKWKQLTEEEANNGKEGKRLVAQKSALTKRLKVLEQATDDNRRSVGKYSDAWEKFRKTAIRAVVGRTLVDGARRLAGYLGEVIKNNKGANEGLAELSDNLGGAASSLENLAVKVLTALAPAINFLLEGFISFIDLLAGGNDGLEKFSATSEKLEGKIKSLEEGFIKESAAANQAFSSLNDLSLSTDKRKELIKQVNKQYGKYLPNLLTEKSSLEDIAKAQQLVNDALNTGFLLRVQQETQTDVFINKTKQVTETFNTLKEAAQSVGKDIDSRFIGAFGRLSDAISRGEVQIGDLKQELNDFEFGDTVFADSIKNLGGDVESFVVSLRDAFRGKDRDLITGIFSKLATDARGYNEAIDDTQGAISALEGQLQKFSKNAVNSSKKTDKAIVKSTSDRLKAIEQLIRAVDQAETNNIKNKQERLLALEELRFKEEQRLTTERLEELKKESKGRDKELLQIAKEGQDLQEAQLLEHENNMFKIRQDNAIKVLELQVVTEEQLARERKEARDKELAQVGLSADAIQESQKKVAEANAKAIEEGVKVSTKAAKDRIEALNSAIKDISAETAKAINGVFDKQVEATASAVEDQLTAVANAEERARLGLENNLKFEQEQLAERKAAQNRALKEQKAAADALALVQLTIAAAQNGDPDPVSSALTQFGILKAAELVVQGSFYHGTEDTGTGGNMDSLGGFLAFLHPHERVLNRADNTKLGSMSNPEVVNFATIGKAITDAGIHLDEMHFKAQGQGLVKAESPPPNNHELVRGLNEVKKAIEKIPAIDTKVEELFENMAILTKTTTVGHMKKVEKIKKSL